MVDEALNGNNPDIHELHLNSYRLSGDGTSSVNHAGTIFESFIGPPENHPDHFFYFSYDKNCARSSCTSSQEVRGFINVGHCKGSSGSIPGTVKYYSGILKKDFDIEKGHYFPTYSSRGCT